jgi:hypothetical protein
VFTVSPDAGIALPVAALPQVSYQFLKKGYLMEKSYRMRKLLSAGALAAVAGFASADPAIHASPTAPARPAASSSAPISATLTDSPYSPDPTIDYPPPDPGWYIYSEGYLTFDDCASDGNIISTQLGFNGGSNTFSCRSGDGPYALYLQDSTGS